MGQGAVGVLEGLRLSGHGKILHLRWTCVPWPTHPARGLGLRPTPELLEEPSSPGYVSMQEARVKKNKDRKGIKFWSRMYI